MNIKFSLGKKVVLNLLHRMDENKKEKIQNIYKVINICCGKGHV